MPVPSPFTPKNRKAPMWPVNLCSVPDAAQRASILRDARSPFCTEYFILRNNDFGTGFGLPGPISAGLKSGKPEKKRPAAGRGANFEASRLESGRNPARKPDFRPGSTIAQHRVHLKQVYISSSSTIVLSTPLLRSSVDHETISS